MVQGHVHVWRKKGTNSTKPGTIVRSWSCYCHASKVRESRGESAPRTTVFVVVREAK